MKKVLLTCVAVWALLASCSLNIETGEKEVRKDSDSTAVGFGVYVNRGVTTKAGWTGDLTTEILQRNESGGFGVFGYYGNGVKFNDNSKPDFMYNQQVTYDSSNSVWSYLPIKYWPNEFGAEAGSESIDRLSFFAYAPFVSVTPETGFVTDTEHADAGILGLSRRTAGGDPLVMYGMDFIPGNCVDLCWGVASDGNPFIDQVKPSTNESVKFEFQHALAQLNVTIDTDIDPEYTGAGLAKGTRVYVRSVTFTGFASRGALDLNSKKSNPAWFDVTGTSRLRRDPVTIYDGRGDGYEGMAVGTDPNEIPAALNKNIVQSLPYSSTELSPGVSKTAVNLFNNNNTDASILVIPVAGAPLTVNIVYDVETIDPRVGGLLSDGVTHGVSIENNITKTVQFSSGTTSLSAGRKYIIGLHLGLNGVTFDAAIADWDHTEYPVEAPINTLQIASVTLSEDSATKWIGENITLPDVIVKANDGTTLTEEKGVKISWSSSDETVATVDPETKAVKVKKYGMTQLRATAEYYGSSGYADFTLYIDEIIDVTITAPATRVSPGGNLTLTATLRCNDSHGITLIDAVVDWSSSDPNVISVPDQKANSIQVTGVAAGRSTITASVSTPYAAETISKTIELTCCQPLGSISLSASSVSSWVGAGPLDLPEVTVLASDGVTDLSNVATISWSSNDAQGLVLTLDRINKKINLIGGGSATLTVTATIGEESISTDYIVAVSEIQYLVWNPDEVNMETGASTIFTITLDSVGEMLDIPDDLSPIITGMNDVTVTLKSGYPQTTDYTATYVYDIVSGSSTGNATATFTLDSKYTTRTIEEVVYIHVTDPTPSPTLFRGYEISSGFLKWDGDKFILSSGIDGGKGVSYFTWSELENATLPIGWHVPTMTDWQSIISDDAINIKINGYPVRKGFCKLSYGGKSYLLLVPDNTLISTSNQSFIQSFGTESFYFVDAQISTSEADYLISLGCVFLPSEGYFNGSASTTLSSGWRYLAQEGYVLIPDDDNGISMATSTDLYLPVVLVKK